MEYVEKKNKIDAFQYTGDVIATVEYLRENHIGFSLEDQGSWVMQPALFKINTYDSANGDTKKEFLNEGNYIVKVSGPKRAYVKIMHSSDFESKYEKPVNITSLVVDGNGKHIQL